MNQQPPDPDKAHATKPPYSGEDMVCVTLRRPPHFWRFACPPGGVGDLLEQLAAQADDPGSPLSWDDAEMIASEIVVHHHLDPPSAGPSKAR